MNEAVKNKMRRFVAVTMAVIMALTALLMLFVRPKAEEATQQIPILNETIVGTVNFQSFNFLGDNASGTDGTDYEATYYYTDDYFSPSSINSNVDMSGANWQTQSFRMLENPSLATASLDLAVAAYTSAEGDVLSATSRTWDNTDYSDKDKNIKAFLSECGFENIEPTQTYLERPTNDSIAYTLARKTITVWDERTQSNKDFTLIAVGVRGAGYGAEWASNVTIGDPATDQIGPNGRHYGFDSSAQQVVAGIEAYIANHNISDDVKYWVSGFSRAAAVANLTAGYLTDRAGEFHTTQDDIYGYTYECPQGATSAEKQLDYRNIHIIINQMDIVPRVSPSGFDHARLGVDYVMPYYGNTSSSEENTEYYERMYRVLQTIAVGATVAGEWQEDPLIKATAPDHYPYNGPLPIYHMTADQVISDAVSGTLTENFGTRLYTGRNKLGNGQWYLDEWEDHLFEVLLTSPAWDARYGENNITTDGITHRNRFIETYQDAFRTAFGYFLDFSGPAFLGMVDAVLKGVQQQLALSNALDNGGLALAFTNFYAYPNNTYRWAWQSGFRPWIGSTLWVGKTRKQVLIEEATPVVQNVVHNMTNGFTDPQGITRKQMDDALGYIVEFVVNLYADELDKFESQYFGTTLHYLWEILSTHEQETVLSWITSLDDNHMNRSYRTLTVPVGTNVKLYEFREQYGETLSADGLAPLVAEFTNGTQVSSLDQRIYMESNGTTMTIRYPSSLDIRSDVMLAPGSSAVDDLDYRVADFRTKQDTTDVSVGATQFHTLSDNNRYTNITNNTSWTNAAAINSASTADAVALGPYDTLKVMANATTSFDNHNTGDENVYTVDVERYHVVTVEETLEDLEGTADANFTLALTLTPPAGGSMPEGGLDVFYNDTTLHFGPNATLENLPADGTVSSLVLPEGWTLAMSQPSANGYLTQKYTITPTGGTASIVEGETASLVVSGDMAVTIQNLYYLPPPTGILEDTGGSVTLLIAIVLIVCGGAGIAYVYRKKDEFVG